MAARLWRGLFWVGNEVPNWSYPCGSPCPNIFLVSSDRREVVVPSDKWKHARRRFIMNSNESWTRQEEPRESVASAVVGPQFPMRYLRFGEFQLDLHREELWKNGERVRLQGKVYQTLLILLSRAGDVVTREEVRRHLWPENPQVN